MNYNEICQLAELDRDEIYGIGNDSWEIYASDLVDSTRARTARERVSPDQKNQARKHRELPEAG